MKMRVLAILAVTAAVTTTAIADGPYTICDARAPSWLWHLCQINIQSGAVEVIGPGVSNPSEPLGLVYHPDGFIYAVFEEPLSLVRLDPATGESAIVGRLGVDLQLHSGPDLGVDESGEIWMLDDRTLYRIDTASGAASPQCSQQSIETEIHLQGLAFTSGMRATIQALPDFPLALECGLIDVGGPLHVEWLSDGPGSQLYGLGFWPHTDGGWGTISSLLYRFDWRAGNWAIVDEYSESLSGLAFSPLFRQQAGAAIPTLGFFAIAAFCGLLALAGVQVLLTRRNSLGNQV